MNYEKPIVISNSDERMEAIKKLWGEYFDFSFDEDGFIELYGLVWSLKIDLEASKAENGRLREAMRTQAISIAQWCLDQVPRIDAGLVIDPNDDFGRGNKEAYQQVAIHIRHDVLDEDIE